MVGGTVVDTKIVDKKLRIDVVADRGSDKASIYVELTDAAKCVQPDDAIWWQGEHALWTPKIRCWHDYKLKRIGNSFTTPGTKKEVVEQEINSVNQVEE